jgi:hypothetical protein
MSETNYEIITKNIYVYKGIEFNSPEEIELYITQQKLIEFLKTFPDFNNTDEFIYKAKMLQPAALKAFVEALV